MSSPLIIVGGALAQRAGRGGHAWVFLQYLLGFRRLGFDVLFVDRLESEMCHDSAGASCPSEVSVEVSALRTTMGRFDVPWVVLVDQGRHALGCDDDALVTAARRSHLLLDVMGYVGESELLSAAPLRAFLDIDPGFGQMWQALGLANLYTNHDVYFTIGENIGKAFCPIPTCGVEWIPTRPPVVLSEWTPAHAHTRPITSVVTWRGSFGPVDYDGATYGLRVHEFRRFAALPQRTHAEYELALDIDDADEADRMLLVDNGWRLSDPRVVAGNADTYREFVRASRAELMIAKSMYVKTRGGWFSDRSVCYLASGRPVVAQDCGVGNLYPTDAGLLTFDTVDEAADQVARVLANESFHARAARALAVSHFDSDLVLRRLLRVVEVAAASSH